MGGRPSYLIFLIAGAYLGAAIAMISVWHFGYLWAVAAAPVGGSLGVLAAALPLLLHGRLMGVSFVGVKSRRSNEIEDVAG